MSVAVMQPYLFPYIGYFQLINAVDTFVFYDDVDFIKGGWIHRNRILVQNRAYFMTVPLLDASSFKKINETAINQVMFDKWKAKFYRTMEQSYSKAPFFKTIFPLVKSVFDTDKNSIAELAIDSIIKISEYLGLKVAFKTSSLDFKESLGQDKLDRLISICDNLNDFHYFNLSGGRSIYSKQDFLAKGVKLDFIENHIVEYEQLGEAFVPGLSMIDLLMFQSKEAILLQLEKYKLLDA